MQDVTLGAGVVRAGASDSVVEEEVEKEEGKEVKVGEDLDPFPPLLAPLLRSRRTHLEQAGLSSSHRTFEALHAKQG